MREEYEKGGKGMDKPRKKPSITDNGTREGRETMKRCIMLISLCG